MRTSWFSMRASKKEKEQWKKHSKNFGLSSIAEFFRYAVNQLTKGKK